jgi:hypothetical protein
MQARRASLGTLLLALAVALPAHAVDRPVDGTRLVLQRWGTGERLVFVSRDPTFLFPAPGGADDPAVGTPGGATVELFSAAEGGAVLAIPPGAGNPGWRVREGGWPLFRFTNREAPGGISPVKVAVLRSGRTLKVVARSVGLPLAGPQGAVGVRVTTGSLRSCALFDAGTVRRDQAGRFSARGAVAAALADCDDASLGAVYTCESGAFPACGGTCPPDAVCGPTGSLDGCACISSSTPCGGTAPVCNGSCPEGEQCASFAGYPLPSCGCIPEEESPCGGPFPVCGGACPTGLGCNPVMLPLDSFCTCTPTGPCGGGGGECQPGLACALTPSGDICLPVLCTAGPSYPTCGAACGGGLWTCQPFTVSSFTGCVCAPPGDPCDETCGGFSCPDGTVCTIGVSCACEAP